MNTIIIVEDNIDSREGLRSIVREIDGSMEILETGSAEEALCLAIDHNIDAFILDIELEDYSGYELAEQLRGINKYKFAQMIFITGFVDHRLDAYVNLHCYKYITKPYEKLDVVKAVEEVIKYGIKRKSTPDMLNFKQNGIVYPVKLGDLKYISYEDRLLVVVTKKEEFSFTGYTLKKIMESLPDEFVRCHKSYIVNMDYTTNLDFANNVVNIDRIGIPIGRKYRKALEELVL